MSTPQNFGPVENFMNSNQDQKIIKYERDKVDLSILDQTKSEKS